jgi:hydrogenase maturation protein HypF
LQEGLPEAARIDLVEVLEIEPKNEAEFLIRESLASDFTFPPIPPDLATCGTCRSELLNPSDRRYLYPFITCTQCGPRYSIVEDTPFDRKTTAMREFPQCEECRGEYGNPLDRRFHSQTNSCQRCGPSLTLKTAAGGIVGGDPVLEAIRALKEGKILALQGIGGFHLAVDPRFAPSLRRLRGDKERERKPFALMVRDRDTAAQLCEISRDDEAMLSSPASPIIILAERAGNPRWMSLVSETSTLGVMLPYTPLHLLLFFHPEVEIPYRYLVMTSGNLKGQPIITDPEAALRQLRDVADLFLYHNRRIVFRTDDSVLRRDELGESYLLRRSRGFVPSVLTIAEEVHEVVLAVGGDLKNAPAFAKGRDVYLAPYIGDLEDPKTQQDFRDQIEKILTLYELEPKVVACDPHPEYYSSRWARDQQWQQVVAVQHHHAHLLSVMAEHGLSEAIGLAFDGTGFGSDGTIWGGEFLKVDRSSFSRLGHFTAFPLPGGDAAVVHPLRTALALLSQSISEGELMDLDLLPRRQARLLLHMIERGLNSPLTSSLGRIFDAAASLLELVETVSYEGEGPIKLEGIAAREWAARGARRRGMGPMPVLEAPVSEEACFEIDASPLIAWLARKKGRLSPGVLALWFHEAIAAASLKGALRLREATGLNRLALSGGVFQNLLLRRLLIPELVKSGFEVCTNRRIPPGDGGLAVGQAYILTK